ncbi:FBD protein [Medicago truncatula]|uniref:FBD protein n=1 Tax=Medicago truncatula TaxID=3880 RepID=A0A072TXX0_MEDTR|nr:FBD protein [Medicago truncatula]
MGRPTGTFHCLGKIFESQYKAYAFNYLRGVKTTHVIYTQARRKKLYRKMRVKHLIMKTALHKFEFMGISFMLKSCPDLERLTIEIVDKINLLDYDPIYNVIPERNWKGPGNDFKCVKFDLKEIEINGFKGTENEFTIINYFLMHGKALRKVSINLLIDDVEGVDADALDALHGNGNTTLVHVLREQNMCANFIVKEGSHAKCSAHWNHPPPDMESLILRDKLGT